MNEAPKISVVIPCFNHGVFLSEAIASVISVGLSDIELIVVDDGSTDGRTLTELDDMRGRGIQVIRQEKKGPSSARNTGIQIAKGMYILPLDADNRLRPAYFEHGVRILDDDPKIGVVYGDAEYLGDRSGRWNVGSFDVDLLLEWNYIDTCAVFRKVVWEQNCGYDEAAILQGLEDWDFWLSTIEHGWQFAYVPEVLFDYRVAEHSMVTQTHGREKEIGDFIAKKHGVQYGRAWRAKIKALEALTLDLHNKEESVRWTARNLLRLAKKRLSNKVAGHAARKDGAPVDQTDERKSNGPVGMGAQGADDATG